MESEEKRCRHFQIGPGQLGWVGHIEGGQLIYCRRTPARQDTLRKSKEAIYG